MKTTRMLLFCLTWAWLASCGQPSGSAAEATSPPASALQPADLSLDQVLARSLAARGGREALLAVKTVRMTGKMTNSQNIADAPITIEKQRQGGKYSRRLVTGGATVTQVVDGASAWEMDPGMGMARPTPMEGPRERRFRRWADIEGPLVDAGAKGHRVELVGKQKLAGGDVYRLKVTYKDGDVSFFLIDAKRFLPVQVIDATPVEAQTVYSDFRKSGGVVWPFDEKTELPRLTQHLVWDKVEVNVPLDAAGFKQPG